MKVRLGVTAALVALSCIVIAMALVTLIGDSQSAQLQHFAAVVSTDTNTVFFDVESGGRRCIALSQLDTWYDTPATMVTHGTHPRLSQTGCWLFFERNAGASHQVWRRSLSAANGEELLIDAATDIAIHDASHDGGSLIVQVTHSSGGLANVTEFRLFDVSKRRYIGEALGLGGCFLSDGDVVFAPADRKGLRLRSRSDDTRSITQSGAFPVASLVGRRVLYLINPTTSFKDREWEVLDLDTNRTHRIGKAASPVFSADGNAVVFLDPKLNGHIYRYDIASGSHTRLGKLPGYLSYWTTSAGGTAGVAMSSTPQLLIVDCMGETLQAYSVPAVIMAVELKLGNGKPSERETDK
jgi:hypothetical protein